MAEVEFERRWRTAAARRGICVCRMDSEKSASSSIISAVSYPVSRKYRRTSKWPSHASALPRVSALCSFARKDERSASERCCCGGITISRPVRLAAQRREGRRGEIGGETARMVEKPRVAFAGGREGGGWGENGEEWMRKSMAVRMRIESVRVRRRDIEFAVVKVMEVWWGE